MTISRRGFFRKTSGAVAGAALVATMTRDEVEAHIEGLEQQSDGVLQSAISSDIYANVPSGALYSQVEVGECVYPGDLLVHDMVQEKYYKAETGMVPAGICISYDDETSTCVMATSGGLQ